MGLAALAIGAQALGAIIIDTSPGTGAPPVTLGGYVMAPFPDDPSPEFTLVNSATPPPESVVTGNLTFNRDVELNQIGGGWDLWSHGYQGQAYYVFSDDYPAVTELMMTMPGGTLGFYFYLQPNLKQSSFEFRVDSEAVTQTLSISGNGGASFVGFYSDDVMDPISFVFVKQTDGFADGFAVGEFAINELGQPGVPEPWAYGLISSVGLLGFAALRRARAS